MEQTQNALMTVVNAKTGSCNDTTSGPMTPLEGTAKKNCVTEAQYEPDQTLKGTKNETKTRWC